MLVFFHLVCVCGSVRERERGEEERVRGDECVCGSERVCVSVSEGERSSVSEWGREYVTEIICVCVGGEGDEESERINRKPTRK